MSVNETLSVLWHRKLIVVVVTLLAIGAAIGGLKLVTPVYESSSTLALSPTDLNRDFVFFSAVDTIVPIYATAAETEDTKQAARGRLDGRLADISVRTFPSAPILKIRARGGDRALVQRSAQAVTDVLLQRVSSGEVGVPSIRLNEIDRPRYPGSPVFPDDKLTIAIAGLLGLGFGIGAAFLRENVSSKIRTRSDLAGAAGVPVYAELPNERALRQPLSPEELVSSPALRPITEALRELRTNLAFTKEGVSSIVVTSPEGSHGKTTVAVGLAATMARAGLRTILVDADLRRGRIHERVGTERFPGLHEALNGANLSGVIRRTGLPNLDVLTGGRLLTDSGELLGSSFPQLLGRLEELYEAVVIDTTPLVPINDARVIASYAGKTIIVASAGGTSERVVREAVERLALLSVRPTAAVLNKSKGRGAKDYYAAAEDHPVEDGAVVHHPAGARSGTGSAS